MKHKLLAIILASLFSSHALAQDEATESATDAVTKTLVWPDGTRYVGGVVDGQRSGKGTIFWQDGTRFVGQFKNDMRNGPGSMILPDGTVFTGFFVDDELVDTRETLSASQSELSTTENEPVIAPPVSEQPAEEVATQLPAEPEPAPIVEATPEPETETTIAEEKPVEPVIEELPQLDTPREMAATITEPDENISVTVNEITDEVQESIIDSVERWRRAWSSQDVDGYLNSYASDFVTPNNQARSTWESTRRSRLLRPAFIQIGVTYERFEWLEPDMIEVQFMQTFKSNTYADETLKSLRMRRTGDGWKIVRERSLNINR